MCIREHREGVLDRTHLSLSPVNHDEVCAAFTISISSADNLLEHCIIVDSRNALDLVIAVLVKLRHAVDEYCHRPHGFGPGKVRHVERLDPVRVRTESKGVFKNVQRICSSRLFKHRFGVLVSKRNELYLRSGAWNTHTNATPPALSKEILNGVSFLRWVLEKDALRYIRALEMEVMLLDKRGHQFSHLNAVGSA